MGSPDTQGPRMPKRHPACPGGRWCQLSGCIHNAFSTDGINSLDFFGGNGMLGVYPSVRLFAGGWLYQQHDAAISERMNIRGGHEEAANATIGYTMHLAQTKVREVSGIIQERIRSWFNSDMPV